MLIWILLLENYGPYIEYIQGNENIVTDTLSRLPINSNQDTTHESTYKKEILSEINDTEESTENIFSNNLKTIDQYQRKDPSLKAKYTTGTNRKVLFVEELIYNLTL